MWYEMEVEYNWNSYNIIDGVDIEECSRSRGLFCAPWFKFLIIFPAITEKDRSIYFTTCLSLIIPTLFNAFKKNEGDIVIASVRYAISSYIVRRNSTKFGVLLTHMNGACNGSFLGAVPWAMWRGQRVKYYLISITKLISNMFIPNYVCVCLQIKDTKLIILSPEASSIMRVLAERSLIGTYLYS